MKTIIKVASCLSVLVLIGCASGPTQMPFVDKVSGETEVGESARAYVGDTVYKKFDIKRQYEGFVTGSFSVLGTAVDLQDVRVQRMLVDGKDGGVTRDTVFGTSWMGVPQAIGPVALIDEDSDGTFERFANMMLGKGKLDTPIFVDWEESNRSRGYIRELLYQGREGDNLKLFYREYSDDFRRPAYDQEVQYDMSESDYIQFKGLTIMVEEANNEYLIYTLEGGSL